MDQNVTLSLQYPNSTEALVLGIFHEPCGPHPSGVSGESFPLNATGTCVLSVFLLLRTLTHYMHDRCRYTVFWNFTYITSSNGTLDPSGCVVAPFSFQSFLLNASFEVQQLSNGSGEVTVSHTTELPRQPTGIVSAATHASTRMGWYGMLASLVGVNVALRWYR
jgi:hypothetical protein